MSGLPIYPADLIVEWAKGVEHNRSSTSLSDAVANVCTLKDKHLSLGKQVLQAHGGTLYYMDLLTASALNRSIAQCDGFLCLIEQDNHLCAGAILRLQLDIAIRYFASSLVNDPHEFAKQVHSGCHIRRLKDRYGKPMTDKYLCEKLGLLFEWIPRVYDKTSGFVHLSDVHMAKTLSLDTKSAKDDTLGTLRISIGGQEPRFSDASIIEMIDAFFASTNVFLYLVSQWAFTKEYPTICRHLRDSR